jgi:hypothetical protein
VKVRATRTGYYADVRRREGDVFTLRNAGHFSPAWMALASDEEAEHTTGAQQSLDALHDAQSPIGRVRRTNVEPDEPAVLFDGDPFNLRFGDER